MANDSQKTFDKGWKRPAPPVPPPTPFARTCIASQGSTPGPRYCSECGTPNKHDAAFCIACGKSLSTGR